MMNSLVRSTYEQLVSRLRRSGTQAKSVSVGALTFESLGFEVRKDGVVDESSCIRVDVAPWHQKNVYMTHDDKIQITLSNLVGQQSQFTFFPRTGNCPPLDKVESKIREALDSRILDNETSTRHQAERRENERLAAQECPQPEASGVSRVRSLDGTYEVRVSLYGLSAAAVRQLYEIERTRDAVLPGNPVIPSKTEPADRTALPAEEPAPPLPARPRKRPVAQVPTASNEF
jgi:hypothetical protein